MHLFSKENIWSNPHSCNNNFVDRIISKEEEREDPRRDSSIYLRVQWCFHIPTRTTVILQELQDSFEYSVFLQELQCFYTQSSHPVQRNYSTYRINSSTRILQEILQLQGSSCADQYKASSSNCSPCIQAILHGRIQP